MPPFFSSCKHNYSNSIHEKENKSFTKYSFLYGIFIWNYQPCNIFHCVFFLNFLLALYCRRNYYKYFSYFLLFGENIASFNAAFVLKRQKRDSRFFFLLNEGSLYEWIQFHCFVGSIKQLFFELRKLKFF